MEGNFLEVLWFPFRTHPRFSFYEWLFSPFVSSPPFHSTVLHVTCIYSSTMVTQLQWSLTPTQQCSPVWPALKQCLLVPLDSDPEVCHPANCFIRTHTKQTEQSTTMTLAADICSLRPFMAALYIVM